MNSNEKWQGKPAGRDGKPFEKREMKSILRGSKTPSKFGGENENRNYNRTDNNNRFESRDGNSTGGEKRRFESRSGNSYGNNNGERRPYDGERRSFNSNDGERRSFNSSNSGERRPYDNNRERRPYDGNSERRPYDGERRSFTSSNNGERRSFNSGNSSERRPYDNNRERRPYSGEQRPYSNRDEDNRPRLRPRTRTNDNVDGNRLTIKKPGEGQLTDFVEYRFDNQNDTPKFRKPMRKQHDGNYNPNAKYSTKKQLEYRKNTVDLTQPVRLNKFLANAGICSRREADEFIQAGVISVNGEVVNELGTKVMHTDKIMFHNQPVRSERKVYLLLNKPKDCVTTSEDTHDRLTVLDLVKNACSERIYPVGRLDRNTTGVILLTNDGDLASKLTHPKFEKKKIYHVALDKALEAKDYEAILAGVELEDFKIAADSLEFVKDGDFKQVGIEIHSGQNRVVRRIFEKLGYKVLRLDRVYFAGLTKKNLPRGKYRFLNEREVNMLKMGAYE